MELTLVYIDRVERSKHKKKEICKKSLIDFYSFLYNQNLFFSFQLILCNKPLSNDSNPIIYIEVKKVVVYILKT